MTETDIIGTLRADLDAITVRLEYVYDTDIADPWSALTEPARLARWFTHVKGDLSPGGIIVIVFGDDDQSHRTVGRVLECEPPMRLVIEWHIEEEPSTVTAELSPTTDGAKLVLEHQRLPAGQAAGYGAAWQAGLEALAADLRGEDGQGAQWDEREKELVPEYQAQLEP
jgi:uncharacterized protein YndB with AHSA1/START domain